MPNLHVSRELYLVAGSTLLSAGSDENLKNNRSGSSGNLTRPPSKEGIALRDDRAGADKTAVSQSSGLKPSGSQSAFVGGEAVGDAGTVHNDRLIDGPLPKLPSIMSGEMPLSSMTSETVGSAGGGGGALNGVDQRGHTSALSVDKTTRRAQAGRTLGQRSFCFSVAGGKASGKICWQLIPSNGLDQGGEPGAARDAREDWRTIS